MSLLLEKPNVSKYTRHDCCFYTGGGSATNVVISITGVSAGAGTPPYIVSLRNQYTVEVSFVSLKDGPGPGKFTVTANPTFLHRPHPFIIAQASTTVQDLNAGTSTNEVVNFEITQSLLTLFVHKGRFLFKLTDKNGENIVCQTAQFRLSHT